MKRQLQSFQNDGGDVDQSAKLQKQLLAIGLDQLYVAFYPTSIKYMPLYQSGSSNRVVDDEKAQRRRKDIWNKIKDGLLKQIQTSDGSNNIDEDLVNAKKWINWDVAKTALMSLPEDVYPNCPGSFSVVPSSKTSICTKGDKKESTAGAPDNRFALIKELDCLFKESTTGDDYKTKLKTSDDDNDDSSVSSNSSDSSEDDADPLAGQKPETIAKASDDNLKTPLSPSYDSSSSSSASSSCSEDCSSDESDAEDVPPKNQTKVQAQANDESESEEDGDDDFFAAENASAGDVFVQLQKNQMKKKRQFDESDTFLLGQQRKADKSRGFATQKQSKRDFRAYQQHQRRQKFG